ncbi:MAG: DUF393 domain-containing protein [Bacteroidetes bacterium]|nr:DUF393 domain-containing protein [Bacteroidota bacterium]MBS1981922.1 DUF393 domain-containing protein [Bacteroidota bacterium]
MKKIVLFDGVCNLCTVSVQFILRHNAKKNIQFASLQSDCGRAQLAQHEWSTTLSTIVYIRDESFFTQSDAVLEICRELNGLYPAFYVFIVVPKFIRNGVYNFIARHRHKWFGKKQECWLPSPEWASRFLN